MGIIHGAPEKPKPDERDGFYIHKGLICYLDTCPDGVYVEGKTPQGELLFRVHKGNIHEAMSFIDCERELAEKYADQQQFGTQQTERRDSRTSE